MGELKIPKGHLEINWPLFYVSLIFDYLKDKVGKFLIRPLVHTDQKGNSGSPKVDDQVAYKSTEGKTEHPEKN